jgi:enterochelin esterase-like enzyme
MIRSITTIVICLLYWNFTMAQSPIVSSGTIQRFENFTSKFVDARKIDVWLPNGYSLQKKYAVLYMHDGNSLYDSSIMWNHQEWGVDETLTKLLKENKIKDVIVVGVWNNGEYRHSEYFPQKILKDIPDTVRKIILEEQLKNKPLADNYLKFLVTEVKPFIDSAFSTLKDRSNTFIAGSSMGGLISLYAICEYPKVFGGAACLSIHTPLIMAEKISGNADKDVASKFRSYLDAHLPNPKTHKIYMDYGDKTLDSFYMPFQKKIDVVMKAKGFTAHNWITSYFPGEDHSEKSWSKRLDIPLLFLLKK